MRQIAEHLVKVGHQVTVATTRLAEREFVSYNGVAIEEFAASGNLINGLTGEIQRYQEFLKTFPADAILINAAQQWTFDAALPVLDAISARKVCIPCGFSGLYWPEFRSYFEKMPDFLRKFDHLIFHAGSYRDIDFAREHNLSNYSIVPNGASEEEFLVPPRKNFRATLGIAEDDFLILTVGAPISWKGHAELAAAFSLLRTRRRLKTFFRRTAVSLILNGDWPPQKPIATVDGSPSAARSSEDAGEISDPENAAVGLAGRGNHLRRARELWREQGAMTTLRHSRRFLVYHGNGLIIRLIIQPWRRFRQKNLQSASKSVFGAVKRHSTSSPPPTIDEWIAAARAQRRKKVLKTSLSREDTVQAFLAADLFVFASNIEYSPLVLFEAAAAGTPFLTVPVGNSAEIVKWTGGGVLCPAPVDELGFTRVDPGVLAKSIETMIRDAPLRRRLGEAARTSFREKFCWRLIAKSYEKILSAPTTETVDKKRIFAPVHMSSGVSQLSPMPISFIVPAYNCQATLRDAIDSIVNGNLSEQDEIVLVDDGSTDGTAAILRELSQDFPFVSVFSHARNRGGGAARNTAVEHARHETIFCLDSDNLLYPGSVVLLHNYLREQDADVAVFQNLDFFRERRDAVTHRWRLRPGPTTLADYLAGNAVAGASGNYMFTRRSWTKAGGYPEFAFLDTWGFGLRQLATGSKMVVLAGTGYSHRYGHQSYWMRESVRHNVSLVALQLLIPFLHLIDDASIDHIMGPAHRHDWFELLDQYPLRLRDGSTGRAGLKEPFPD